MRQLGCIMLIALFAAAAPALAQRQASARPARVPWSSLSPPQQRLLARFHGEWTVLPAGRQHALSSGSERWLLMTPAQRRAVRRRFKRWKALPAEKRKLLRRRWETFESLSPRRRQAMLRSFRKFERLPPARRRQLKAQWRSATPQQRERMLEQARQRALRRGGVYGPFGPRGVRHRMARPPGLAPPRPLGGGFSGGGPDPRFGPNGWPRGHFPAGRH